MTPKKKYRQILYVTLKRKHKSQETMCNILLK